MNYPIVLSIYLVNNPFHPRQVVSPSSKKSKYMPYAIMSQRVGEMLNCALLWYAKSCLLVRERFPQILCTLSRCLCLLREKSFCKILWPNWGSQQAVSVYYLNHDVLPCLVWVLPYGELFQSSLHTLCKFILFLFCHRDDWLPICWGLDPCLKHFDNLTIF